MRIKFSCFCFGYTKTHRKQLLCVLKLAVNAKNGEKITALRKQQKFSKLLRWPTAYRNPAHSAQHIASDQTCGSRLRAPGRKWVSRGWMKADAVAIGSSRRLAYQFCFTIKTTIKSKEGCSSKQTTNKIS